MNADKFDVVIAGGGPAGSAAAFTLASHGFRVCVVDKYSFPRDKLCGGLLTLRAKKNFQQVFRTDWSSVIHRTARGAKFYFQSALLNSVTDYRDISFTCRREFDNFLLQLAVQRGAALLEKETVKSIDLGRSVITLASGKTLAFDFLIGADGVNSTVARHLFGEPFRPETIGFGLELEVPLSRDDSVETGSARALACSVTRPRGTHGGGEPAHGSADSQRLSPTGEGADRHTRGRVCSPRLSASLRLSAGVPQIADPEIYFGLIDWGYGWVFPKRDTLTVGVGGSLRKNPDLMSSFKDFLRQRFGEIPAGKIKGHHIPFGDFRRVPGRGNILLCGDAAGLVEPITGEGIAFAMQSGHFAAEAIRDAAARRSAVALDFYQPRYETIAASFRHANRLRHFLFPRTAQKLFSKILPRTDTIPRRHLDLMADEITYAEYGKFLLSKAATAPLRIFG